MAGIVVLSVCLSVAAVYAKTTKEMKSKKVHQECTMCHADKDYKDFGETRSKVNTTCLKCHPNSTRNDHPIGRVSLVVSDILPLDEEKRLTCITCHDPHGRNTVEKLLRMSFNRLCIVCHRM